MKTSTSTLRALWSAHSGRTFPRERPHSEVGPLDYFDLVELDTFMAGYLSRAAEGEVLEAESLSQLNLMLEDLGKKVESLSGETHEYFASLYAVAEVAVASYSPIR